MSGIAEASWPQVIRALLDRGVVVQEGQKRGAKYRLPR
jgi:tRNA splicing endonuclease